MRIIFREIIKQSVVKERPLYNSKYTFASEMINRLANIVWVSNMLRIKMFELHSQYTQN